MNSPITLHYGLMCLESLSDGSPEPMTLKEISKRQGVPSHDCAIVLARLRAAGIVHEDASGAFILRRPVNELSVAEVMRVLATKRNEPLSKVCFGTRSAERLMTKALQSELVQELKNS